MRYTPVAIAALMLFGAGCSNDDRETSLVPEAQAAQPQPKKDYGWQTTPDFSGKQDEVRDYQ